MNRLSWGLVVMIGVVYIVVVNAICLLLFVAARELLLAPAHWRMLKQASAR